jgi:DNA-binding response OmpR family regulator
MTNQISDHRESGLEVALLNWPEDEVERRRLAASRLPRLLLVGPGVTPPIVLDELEDWVRFPLDADELAVRAGVLAARASDVPTRPASLILDDDGMVHHSASWVLLAPMEQRLLAALLARPAQVVSRSVLRTAGWQGATPADPRAVDGVIRRLRRRLAPLGVSIHTIAGAGYLLDHGAADV